MTMVCKICNHPNRRDIDRQIVQGLSHAKIAKQYDVDAGAVWRHAQNHLSRQMVTAFQKKDAAENLDLLGRIESIISRAEKIFRRNYEAGKDLIALKAISEQRATLELLSKIACYLHESRAAELQTVQSDYQSRREQEDQEAIQKALDILNPAEVQLWIKIQEKIAGQFDGDIIEYAEMQFPTWQSPYACTDDPYQNQQPEPVPAPEPVKKIQRTKKPMRNTVKPIEATQLQPSK